ncbi:MAG: Crp/Fnr family transcriptional regulator [Gemmatimonadetes bacterium]|nr:Crp/Fnr family transcriptional regulator [Gemmatimonadota bacterium]
MAGSGTKLSTLPCASCGTRLAHVLELLDADAVTLLDRAHGSHTYARGQILFYESTAAHSVFCLRSGVAKVSRATSQGRAYILRIARPGEILGLENLLDGKPYAATAEMLEGGAVCQFDRERFVSVLERHPAAWREIATAVAEELRRCEEERSELASRSLRTRLAAALIHLGQEFGAPEGGAVHLHLDLSRDDLASMIGASTEATIRQLSELRRRGLVSTDHRSIRIEDIGRLARVARLTPPA